LCIITNSYNHVTADVFPVELISFWPCYSVCGLCEIEEQLYYEVPVANEAADTAVVHWECSDIAVSNTASYSGMYVCVCVCVCITFVCDNPLHAVAKMCKKLHTLLL